MNESVRFLGPPPTAFGRRGRLTTAMLAGLLLVGACSDDDGAAVRGDEPGVEVIGGDDGGSASASASAPAGGDGTPTPAEGGYDYATDVSAHRLVVADVCDIAALLDADPVDFDAVEAIYRDGEHSVNSDGSVRTLAGFATSTDRLHGLDDYYATDTPLDDFVTAALQGSGEFDGASDAARIQGVEKGIQNQVLVAWTRHELRSALTKATDGDLDPQEGAVHNWDEAWAFYAGSEPGCAPYATADKRAADFGTTVGGGSTSRVNANLLDAMIAGRDALLAEDVEGAEAAAAEVEKNLVITYSQATIRYATLVPGDVADGDLDGAAVHRAEGLAFWRVIEAIASDNGADVDAVNDVLRLDGELGEQGGGEDVRVALQPMFDALGITDADIGELG